MMIIATMAVAPAAPSTAAAPSRTLAGAAHELTADIPALAAAGIRVEKVSVDAAQHRLKVGVRPGTRADVQRTLAQRLPGIDFQVSYLRVRSAAGAGPYEPGPPWLSGMELYSPFRQGGGLYYRECTAGFNVVAPSTGRTYLTTAGHCFTPGSVILHSTRSTGQRVGMVSARAGYGTTADTELISSAAGNLRNTVLIGNGVQRNVSAYRPTTPVGTAVCKSGITTGQTCGNIVRSRSATVCYPGAGCVYGQQETYNPRLAKTAYYGDSGGPVYTYSRSGSVIAAGAVSGFEETCDARGANCRLDGVMFFTPIKNMHDTLGVVP